MKFTRKKFFKLNKIVGICCLSSAIIFSGVTFLKSGIEYLQYEKQYEKNEADIFAKTPEGPESVIIDNEYITYEENGNSIESTKSQYNHIYTCLASEATYSSSPSSSTYAKPEVNNPESPYGTNVANIGNSGGGSLEFKINVDYGCYADIDVVISSAFYSPLVEGNIPTESLTDWIKMTVNNINIDASNITLPVEDKTDWFNFQHLILKNVHLITGENILRLETLADHPYHTGEFVFPNVSRIHVMADSNFEGSILDVKAESSMISYENESYYFNLSGTAIGYDAEQLFMDLCYRNQTYNRVPNSAYSCEIEENRFEIKINLDTMIAGTYYPHFYIDGELSTEYHKDGRIGVKNMSSFYKNKTIVYQEIDRYTINYVDGQLVLVIK